MSLGATTSLATEGLWLSQHPSPFDHFMTTLLFFLLKVLFLMVNIRLVL